MPTLHDLMSASIDGRAAALGAADASPGGATRGLIARRRRRNAVAAGGTSALAIGGLVVAGLAQDSRADHDPASADPNAIEYVDIPLDSVSTNGTEPWSIDLQCGDEVPPSSASLEGFSQATAILGDPTIDRNHASASLSAEFTYDGPDHSPVFIESGYAVLAKDGVVVATFSADQTTDAPLTPLITGASWDHVVALTNPQPCPVDGAMKSGDAVAIAAGDYEVYMISQAYVTEPEVALLNLAHSGYFLTPRGSGNWAPGSIDCQTQIEWSGISDYPIPLECAPESASDAVIDADAGVARLSYRATDYTEDVSVTEVSPPVAFSITADITWDRAGYGWQSRESVNAKPAQLTCEATFDYVETRTSLVGGVAARSLDDLLTGTEVSVDFDTQGGISRGTVTAPSKASAWLVSFDPDGSGEIVVGQATVDLLPSGTILIDRWSGYPDASMRLTDVTWCGVTLPDVQSIVIMGDVTITGDAPNETSDAFMVYVNG